ncbi:MAG: hypothetical protein WAJ85_08100 [Candidatus Baltobacteraceae bacterium]
MSLASPPASQGDAQLIQLCLRDQGFHNLARRCPSRPYAAPAQLTFEICETVDRGWREPNRHRLLGWLGDRERFDVLTF